jgi:hypothetical protein
VTPVHDADDVDDIFGEDYCVDDDDDDAPADDDVLDHGAPSSPAKQTARKAQDTAAVTSPTASTQAFARRALHFLLSACASKCPAVLQADVAADTHLLLLRFIRA